MYPKPTGLAVIFLPMRSSLSLHGMSSKALNEMVKSAGIVSPHLRRNMPDVYEHPESGSQIERHGAMRHRRDRA
jgi:hypothetical protein